MTMKKKFRYIDLFCGIGGFRVAAQEVLAVRGLKGECVFSCDIDEKARQMYEANFGEPPFGDITKLDEADVPRHDILFAGFPCQPFSIIGDRQGFSDARGTLFFDIARILKAKQPGAFVLENVKQLASHGNGQTLSRIYDTLTAMGYRVHYRILNALNYGLPQKRERVFIVGYRKDSIFRWPDPVAQYTPLSKLLEKRVPKKFYASEYIRERRKAVHSPSVSPSLWHENKAGNVSSHPFSCALRAGASYNYLLVDGERRLTPREMLRLQGFPDSYKIVVPDGDVRKQAGNSVPVPVVKAVFSSLLDAIAS